MGRFLTLDRLNVWFSRRCGIRETKTSEDIERAWQWIRTDHADWTDYSAKYPAEANFAIKEVKRVLYMDLESQIVPPLDSTDVNNLMVEYVFDQEGRL